MSISSRPGLIWGMLIGYCGLVFIGSSVSHVPEELCVVPDYVLHSVEYLIMGFLAHLAFRTRPLAYSRGISSVLAVLFCLAYAASDEFHQSFVGGRTPSIRDIGADVAGAFVAQLIHLGYRHFAASRGSRRG